MAEMTANEAIEKLDEWIEYLGSPKKVELKYADAQQITALIQQQQQQIERLKCCGNCEHWAILCGDVYKSACAINCVKGIERNDKCINWELLWQVKEGQ